jgi:GT2 family glycosyltransferase
MIHLSIVIVNYNVQYFLDQCLASVNRAKGELNVEVFVVDNASVDESELMVQHKYPWVVWIGNKQNVGFSRANNQAIAVSQGKYVLLLNPDTVVEEDTLLKCWAFMENHPEAGALGVRMVDGKGRFLPESKRGIPYPRTSFFKISGLYRIFPSSSVINHYYLGHLLENENNPIEILSGAFMFMRKEALDKVGYLDEDFFMYGEDIDLSWRILKGGYQNYYLADTRIIHYKGESTKKGSLNYVYVFYQAMVIFANKHFSDKNAFWYNLIIKVAIWARASMSVLKRVMETLLPVVMDLVFTLGGWWIMMQYYADWKQLVYPNPVVLPAFIGSGLMWVVSAWLGGLYDSPYRRKGIAQSIGTASILILLVYSLLPETMRFSRFLVLAGSAWAMVVFALNRVVWTWTKKSHTNEIKKSWIVGSTVECERMQRMMHYRTQDQFKFISREEILKYLSDQTIQQRCQMEGVSEVVFSGKDMSSMEIISIMAQLSSTDMEMKIAPPESLFIIGSQHIERGETEQWVDLNSVGTRENVRKKRFLDVVVAVIGLILYPLVFMAIKHPGKGLLRTIQVLVGQRTWIGFGAYSQGMPKIRKGVLFVYPPEEQRLEVVTKYNTLYAKDYRWQHDLGLIMAYWRNIGK